MTGGWILATVAVMEAVNVKAMGPAIVSVGIPFLGGAVGVGLSRRHDSVGWAIVITTVVIVGMV